MGMPQSFSGIADGNIYPCRFVENVAGSEGHYTQAGAGEKTRGISQEGTRRIDYIDSNGYAAIATEPFMYYGPGARCLLEIVATVALGDRLKSDADGKGTPVAADREEYGAIADQTGVSGQRIWVFVVAPTQTSQA